MGPNKHIDEQIERMQSECEISLNHLKQKHEDARKSIEELLNEDTGTK